jgi:hypothetical protein
MRQNEEITLPVAVMYYFMVAVNKTTNHVRQNRQLTSVPHSSARGHQYVAPLGNIVRPAARFVNYIYTRGPDKSLA